MEFIIFLWRGILKYDNTLIVGGMSTFTKVHLHISLANL